MSATAHPEPLTRAEAARRNGALSRGPVTAEGKARIVEINRLAPTIIEVMTVLAMYST